MCLSPIANECVCVCVCMCLCGYLCVLLYLFMCVCQRGEAARRGTGSLVATRAPQLLHVPKLTTALKRHCIIKE